MKYSLATFIFLFFRSIKGGFSWSPDETSPEVAERTKTSVRVRHFHARIGANFNQQKHIFTIHHSIVCIISAMPDIQYGWLFVGVLDSVGITGGKDHRISA